MKTFGIKDLSLSEELEREAMARVRGGFIGSGYWLSVVEMEVSTEKRSRADGLGGGNVTGGWDLTANKKIA